MTMLLQTSVLTQQARDLARQASEALDAAKAALSGLEESLAEKAFFSSMGAADPFVFQLAVFVLAVFVGYYVVWSITPSLHAPLMAVTNAISSVIVVGALIGIGADASLLESDLAIILALIALACVSVNIFGGFWLTERMLKMYRKKVKS